MAVICIKTDSCKGCGLCVDACPKKLLQISKLKINIKGHHPAEIVKPEECVGCASCALMCPDCVISIKNEER